MLDYLLDGENKVFILWNRLEYEKHDALHNIIVLESKSLEIKYHLNELIELKTRFYNLSLCYCKKQVDLKNNIFIIKA